LMHQHLTQMFSWALAVLTNLDTEVICLRTLKLRGLGKYVKAKALSTI
jgi:hypothetical protein